MNNPYKQIIFEDTANFYIMYSICNSQDSGYLDLCKPQHSNISMYLQYKIGKRNMKDLSILIFLPMTVNTLVF